MSSGLSSTPINGHHFLNGSRPESIPNSSEAGSDSYQSNGYTDSQSIYLGHDQNIIGHLYEYGFQRGDYADTILHAHQNVYRLHAIILSRSPLLVQLMSTSPQVGSLRTIYVSLDREPEITQEGFAIALGYLYSSISLRLIRNDNARAVLAAGCMLGGMEDLCEYAYETCRRSISVDTITSWLEFIDTIPLPSSGAETRDIPPVTVFGLYAKRIRDDVFHFLVVALPELLNIHGTSNGAPTGSEQHGREKLLQIFSRVPFEMFKTAVESPSFQIGSDQARFKFAKDAIEIRKRGIARGSGCEETVVLAFGGGGSAVHVTRKMRKRPLWKVNS